MAVEQPAMIEEVNKASEIVMVRLLLEQPPFEQLPLLALTL